MQTLLLLIDPAMKKKNVQVQGLVKLRQFEVKITHTHWELTQVPLPLLQKKKAFIISLL